MGVSSVTLHSLRCLWLGQSEMVPIPPLDTALVSVSLFPFMHPVRHRDFQGGDRIGQVEALDHGSCLVRETPSGLTLFRHACIDSCYGE